MSSVKLGEYMLWKSIKRKRADEFSTSGSRFSCSKIEEIVFPNEMICRVCTSPADIPIKDKINGMNILSAIRTVSGVQVTNTDPYPKYVCKSCLEELRVALEFKKKCESSDYLFRQTQPQTFENNSLTMVMHDFALIIHQMKERGLARSISIDSKAHRKRNKLSASYPQDPNEEKEARPTKVLKCQRCDLSFDSKDLLIQHRLQQNCVCPPCPLCGKLVSNLARHKKNVHLRTEKYTCHVCSKISYSSGALRNHLLVHSDKCDYPCPLCPYKGKQQSYLTLHMRIHTGERPYLCSECPSKFVNPSNLRKHELTHASKNFECNKCKKQFRLLKTLQEHYEAAHLNVRYRCSICGRDLWTRRKLLSHELRVHNREKHKLFDEVYKVVLNNEND